MDELAGTKQSIEVEVRPKVNIPEYKESLAEKLNNLNEDIQEPIQALNNFGDALSRIEHSFETLSDSGSSWIDKLKAVGDILDNTTKVVGAVANAISLLGDTELAEAAKSLLANKLKRRDATKNVAANTAEAGSGAAASVASIPYVGPILAAAAVASIVALLATTLPKYAKGGFIQGGSKYGDKLLARVNAGEAILNSRQQKNFMDMANGKYSGGGQVEFVISGKSLKGVLRNVDAANSKIAGARGL
jgi:uncharacterized protein YoxC